MKECKKIWESTRPERIALRGENADISITDPIIVEYIDKEEEFERKPFVPT